VTPSIFLMILRNFSLFKYNKHIMGTVVGFLWFFFLLLLGFELKALYLVGMVLHPVSLIHSKYSVTVWCLDALKSCSVFVEKNTYKIKTEQWVFVFCCMFNNFYNKSYIYVVAYKTWDKGKTIQSYIILWKTTIVSCNMKCDYKICHK
jgi:hypothetical protein